MRRAILIAAVLWTACGQTDASPSPESGGFGSFDDPRDDDGAPVDTVCDCQPGFVCEFGQCVPEVANSTVSDPRASLRFVFDLQVADSRLIRIDSSSLQARSFSAGLAPMDLAVEPQRELSILLDAFDLVEILDHRNDPPDSATYETARALSHLASSPTGTHVVAYYDWDDPRSGLRQPEPGNINQVTVLDLRDGATAFADSDRRATNVSVALLPRDIRFSIDGSRLVVVGRDEVTRISLGDVPVPDSVIALRAEPAEVAVDDAANALVARYDSGELELVRLDDGASTCVTFPGPISDIERASPTAFYVVYGADSSYTAALLEPLDADFATGACTPLNGTIDLGPHARLQMNSAGSRGLAFTTQIDRESVLVLEGSTTTELRLEKAVSSLVFGTQGRFVFVSHLKREGTPAWDPTVETPDESVDKSYGVTWIDLETLENRLAISEEPFGRFTFAPETDGRAAATYVAVLDPVEPELLRVTHAPGFSDRWLRLAASPLALGFLAGTDRAYVTQDHPWGRVTFIDPSDGELRHVTGFAIEP